MPEELETFREEGRLQIVAVSEDEAPGRFDNDYFSFIYINPTLRGIKYDLDDWFPKLHEGGLFAGKDYCASKGGVRQPGALRAAAVVSGGGVGPWGAGSTGGGRG